MYAFEYLIRLSSPHPHVFLDILSWASNWIILQFNLSEDADEE